MLPKKQKMRKSPELRDIKNTKTEIKLIPTPDMKKKTSLKILVDIPDDKN